MGAATSNRGFMSYINAQPADGKDSTMRCLHKELHLHFLRGSTYIGGTTARNTFDLWKSTLTEYQLEALEAGTLVAPANVSSAW